MYLQIVLARRMFNLYLRRGRRLPAKLQMSSTDVFQYVLVPVQYYD